MSAPFDDVEEFERACVLAVIPEVTRHVLQLGERQLGEYLDASTPRRQDFIAWLSTSIAEATVARLVEMRRERQKLTAETLNPTWGGS